MPCDVLVRSLGRHTLPVDASDDAAKASLRASLGAVRRARTDAAIEAARAAVRDVVVAQVSARGAQRVAGYVPLRTEPGSVELLDALVAAGVETLVPLTLPDRSLDWVRWPAPVGAAAAADGVPGLGVDAIAGVDVVVVPALAVAADGTRLGRGGGSYDRALARVRPSALVVALVYDDELVPSLPAEPWDVPVGAVATPSGWWAVGNPDFAARVSTRRI